MSAQADEQSRTATLAAALKSGTTSAALRAFLPRYYRHVPVEDLAVRAPEALLGQARAHLELAQKRPVGTANVRVFNPDAAADGFTGSPTLILAVTDDMPFLVDSVSWELSKGNRIRLIVHPLLNVRRDATGKLQEVVDVDEALSKDYGVSVESWMCLEVEHVPAAELPELERKLREILGDVRDAVEDWPKMQERCAGIAADLRLNTALDSGMAEQAADFATWLADNHFTFLGYREYTRTRQGSRSVLAVVPGSGLGQWRYDQTSPEPVGRATAEMKELENEIVIFAKDDSRATVHRAGQHDVITFRTFDAKGKVIGERRIMGLYTSSAFNSSVLEIPIVRKRVQDVIAAAGYMMDSHSGRGLLQVMEGFPRDEMMQLTRERLAEIVPEIFTLKSRGGTGVFLRKGVQGKFLSALVYFPRDRYTTTTRLRIADLLTAACQGEIVDYTARVNEWSLARLHFLVRIADGHKVPDIDVTELERSIAQATRSWDEDFSTMLHAQVDGPQAADLLDRYAGAFPESYKEDVPPKWAVADMLKLEAVAEGDENRYELYQEGCAPDNERRIKLYRTTELSLTQILPMFTHLGVEVIDERPYEIGMAQGSVHVFDVGLRARDAALWQPVAKGDDAGERFVDAVGAVAAGQAESDGFQTLVLAAGLTWRQVVILRALAKYLKQAQATFTQESVESALVANAEIAGLLVQLFETRFDPTRFSGKATAKRASEEQAISDRILTALDAVASLEHDRVIRALLAVIHAVVRTNYWRTYEDESAREFLSMKIECRKLDLLPMPRPLFEIWVYGPRVEGVHLRFGKVARGGLRWSDRREDFRTEVLGLVKAQTVKNVVIVPTGSKGGFFAKQLPDPAIDRDAWMEEGISAYKLFISGLLDLTDNLISGEVVPPADVVRHDPDDTYLVVAADKGTAKFSDFANGRSQDYGFWLDDAFASGGSAGYDHKGMGITARGAWESVKRHFREIGVDTQSEDFTAVGVGDMSGDVFGNGMLLSEHIRLVAAFDHRHVFIDPSPDATTSYQERARLFDLPRSSWADYDAKLISKGGGVFPRSAKSIAITAEMIDVLGLPEGTTSMTPTELIHACLLAPVDLLWNGGIGTYVKASFETNAQIGDRANDAIRVNGKDLRVKVIGEGGNLGCSQNGRIEAALTGIHVNTDAIDNSAGVDTSDHEVNIKILLTGLMKQGVMTLAQRNKLLESMTDEVGHQVLRDNYEQNALLGNARAQSRAMLPVHKRLIHQLEETVDLDRALEFLPTDAELTRREQDGIGLASPEFSVLVAYAKIFLKKEILASDVPDDPWCERMLAAYFPTNCRKKYGEELLAHPLRREIITNAIANLVVNRGGITFVLRAMEETGASVDKIVRAFVICHHVFGVADYCAQMEALDNAVPTTVQTQMYLEVRRLLDRSVRWVLGTRPTALDIASEIERFAAGVQSQAPRVAGLLAGDERTRMLSWAGELQAAGVPQELARFTSSLLDQFSLLDAVNIAEATKTPLGDVVEAMMLISEKLMIDSMLTKVSQLPRESRWDAMARAAMRDDLYAVLDELTRAVLSSTSAKASPEERLAQWVADNDESLTRARTALTGVDHLENAGIAPLSVVLRTLRTVASR